MNLSWSNFKNIVEQRSLSIQYVSLNDRYILGVTFAGIDFTCIINVENPITSDQIDFENNFKTISNKPVIIPTSVETIPYIGTKNFTKNGVVKKLYARDTGFQKPLIQGINEISYTSTYPWAKIVGAEVIGCQALDVVDFKVYDTTQGSYSGYPNLLLNQFCYSLNLTEGSYHKIAQFDADIYVGMVVKITYTSISQKTVGINIIINEVV